MLVFDMKLMRASYHAPGALAPYSLMLGRKLQASLQTGLVEPGLSIGTAVLQGPVGLDLALGLGGLPVRSETSTFQTRFPGYGMFSAGFWLRKAPAPIEDLLLPSEPGYLGYGLRLGIEAGAGDTRGALIALEQEEPEECSWRCTVFVGAELRAQLAWAWKNHGILSLSLGISGSGYPYGLSHLSWPYSNPIGCASEAGCTNSNGVFTGPGPIQVEARLLPLLESRVDIPIRKNQASLWFGLGFPSGFSMGMLYSAFRE
jgi:hypothetical protein